MEKLIIEVPVSVGDKAYRTTNTCNIEKGKVVRIRVWSNYCEGDNGVTNESKIEIMVNYGLRDDVRYSPEDLGTTVFLTKKDLIQHIIGNL